MRALVLCLLPVACTPAAAPLLAEPAEAAQSLVMGISEEVAVTTAVKKINGVGGADWVVVSEGDVDVYIVLASVEDGGVVPDDGRELVPAGAFSSIKIQGTGDVGVAGVSESGSVRLRFTR
jgi:hypothetical protein